MIREKHLGHGVQGLLRPRKHPIDGGATDQSRKVSAAVPQGIALGGHAQYNVQILDRPIQEERPDAVPGEVEMVV